MALLGADDPIIRSLDLRRDLRQQAFTATAALACGAVAIAFGARWGLFLLVPATLVDVVLLTGIALAGSSVRARARDLIIEGRDDIDLAPLVRERQRLVDPRRRIRLARAVEHLIQTAERWPTIIRSARPVFDPTQVLAVAPELRAIAKLLTASKPKARGVALAEQLLTSGTSPLYAQDTDDLRCALESILNALARPQSNDSP